MLVDQQGFGRYAGSAGVSPASSARRDEALT
jgi:hypothetical protein